MWGGILAGAMGGGAKAAVDIADGELAQRRKTELMQLEQQLAIERAEAIARRQQTIDRENQTYNTTGQGGAEKLDFKKRESAVETEAEVAKRRAVDPLDVAKAGDMEGARQTAATNATKARGADKDYLRARQAETDAGESTSTKSSRAESTRGSRLENDEKAELTSLRKRAEEMRARGDEEGAKKIDDQIARRKTGKGANEKSYSDVVQAAAQLNKLAESAEMEGTPDSASRAAALRRQAENMLTSVGEKRGVSGGGGGGGGAGRLAVGAVVDGYRFLGGNPNDKNSWAPASQSGAGSVK